MEIINFQSQKKTSLTNKQQKSYQNTKHCYICKEKFEDKHAKDKNYFKVMVHCHYTKHYRGCADSICSLKYIMPQEIPKVSHNRSNYDYNFTI